MLDNLISGLGIIFHWEHILAIVVGSSLGLVVGAIPGLTATMAVALILPMTFDMDFVTSIMLLVGAYKGGIFGGSITAILLNTPGTPASAATVLDGYTLTKQGKGVKALKMAKYSSTLADFCSDLVLIAVAAPLATVALKFGPPEIAMLIAFSLTIVAGVAGKSIIKGLIAGTLGLLLATVGLDPIMTTRRLSFNIVELDSGISLIPLLIGLFALSEVLFQLGKKSETYDDQFVIKHSSHPADNRVSWIEFKRSLRTIIRGTAIGTGIGIIPGIGTGIASFMSYAQAKRASKTPEKFGRGSLEGIAASESGNSAVVGATFIPLLTMGIPGDIITAVIMGAFMIQGFIPGPLLFQDHSQIIYAIFIGFIICDIVYFIIGTVALGVLAGEKPDGYILSAGTSTGIFRIPVQRKVPYKPLADFTHIFAYAAVSSGVVVKPDAPWQTWQEFVDYAKKNPGKVKYSTTGAGSPMHVSMEVAAEKEGIKWIHVPYKGSMPSITAVLGGHVEACSSGPKFVSMVQQGQLRVLGVHTKERMAEFPDVPTFMELGYNYINDTFFSVHGPAGMDPAVVKKLEEAFAKSVDTAEFKDMAKKFALQPLQIDSAEYTKILEDGWPKQVQIFIDLGRIKEAATRPR